MGADGVAIAFVTPEQGEQLTNIEAFINQQIDRRHIEGFEAYTPPAAVADDQEEAPRTVMPVFGRRTRRYSNRL